MCAKAHFGDCYLELTWDHSSSRREKMIIAIAATIALATVFSLHVRHQASF